MKRKNLLIVLGVLIGICVLIGGSYAIWRLTVSQTGQNRILVSCLNLTLTKEENVINLENAYLSYDEECRTLTPYSFTIKNTCDIFASFVVQLEMTSHSTLPTQYIRAMVNNEEILNLNEYEESTEYVDSDTTEARILARGALGEGDSEDYTLRLWIDSDVDQFTTDAIGKTLSAKITITAAPSTYSPVENGITTLHDAILANEYQTSNIEVAKEKIAAKQQPDFTKTAPIIDWQEASTSSTTATIDWSVARKEDVGSDLDYATDLDENSAVVAFSNTYTFDSETGRYYLGDLIYQDPSTIDFSSNDYYICSSGTEITSTGKLRVYHNVDCSTMYKITGLSRSEEITVSGSDGTAYPAMRYTFRRSELYTQTELESDKSDKGLYAATDDYGTSYYYRGSVNNNYVYFAGYYWRIIRINGNGSIRLLYAGETKDATGEVAQIGTNVFNSQRNLPLYVGYMYGDTNGSSLEEVNANTNDSTIKSYLDSWYTTNLSEYSSYIADSGFCNDRTISSSSNGNGIQTDINTNYAPFERYYREYNPTLVCPDAGNDLFTVSATNGNKALTYPIGLITIDELMLAGARNTYVNKSFYPFSGYPYRTISPSHFGAGNDAASEFRLSSDGIASGYFVSSGTGVRPVINLNADVEITGGIGTQNEPFVVKTT